MIRTTHNPFSTLRLFDLSAGADPETEPLLANAGILLEPEGARPSWDGAMGPVNRTLRFLTTTGNDLTGPELKALANRLNDLPLPIGLSEVSSARVSQLFAEAVQLLDRSPEPGSDPSGTGGPV